MTLPSPEFIHPYYAYHYALSVDQTDRDDTREAASKDPEYEGLYCLYVGVSVRKEDGAQGRRLGLIQASEE